MLVNLSAGHYNVIQMPLGLSAIDEEQSRNITAVVIMGSSVMLHSFLPPYVPSTKGDVWIVSALMDHLGTVTGLEQDDR